MSTVDFPMHTCGKESVARILKAVGKWEVKDMLVVGIQEDGTILISGTSSDAAEINFYLDAAKMKVLDRVLK